MSVKAVKAYYEQIAAQYIEMKNDIAEFEVEASKGLVAPELIERLTKQLEPIKNNYMTLSYIMFLLNQPQKRSKQARYAKQNNQLLKISSGRQDHNLIAENEACLNGIKGLTAQVREDNQ